jgi:hypothetical protein
MILVLTLLIALLIDATPQKMGQDEQKRLAMLRARLEGRIHPERGVPIAIWEDGAMLTRIVDPEQGSKLLEDWTKDFEKITSHDGALFVYNDEKANLVLLIVIEGSYSTGFYTISTSPTTEISSEDRRRVLSYLVESGIYDRLKNYGPRTCDLLDDIILVDDKTFAMLKAVHKLSLKTGTDQDRGDGWREWCPLAVGGRR